MQLSKDQMLKELGDIASQRNPGLKPKQARRGISKFMKKASYEQWLVLYNDTIKGGSK